MVRFINKNLKAHYYIGQEKISDLVNIQAFNELTSLITLHLRSFHIDSVWGLNHLIQKLGVQLGINGTSDFNFVLSTTRTDLKDLFLTIEIILESFHEFLKRGNPLYFVDFVEDLNELFLIHKIQLQIRYLSNKKEYFIEKIISPEVSEEIKKTLENFSKEERVFEDFKEAIKLYSSSDFEESIERCCVAIEDYLCIILGKKTCQSVDTYYKEVSKKFNIAADLDNRFSNIVSFIHKYRSHQNHGSIEKKEIPEPELTTQTIIQFTMIILNYLKKKKEMIK